MPLTLSSTAFRKNGEIPDLYTCDGENVPPPLEWHGIPHKAKSLALIVDDPDAPDPRAPTHTFVHWVLYDIPPSMTGLSSEEPAPATARQGLNGWKKRGYGGPCPPVGRHRYFFKLYALDTMLGELSAPTKDGLEKAMRDHLLEKAELVGTYERVAATRR